MSIIKFIGLPGCGKTSIIDLLSTNTKLNMTRESDIILDKYDLVEMYTNPRQNTIVYHLKLLEEFQKQYKKEKPGQYKFYVEHTPFEMFEFFTLANLQAGNITSYGYRHLKEKSVGIKMAQYVEHEQAECIYIYITAPPETCIENMKKRNRDGEFNVNLQMFLQINAFIASHMDNNFGRKLIVEYKENNFHIKEIVDYLQSDMKIGCIKG